MTSAQTRVRNSRITRLLAGIYIP